MTGPRGAGRRPNSGAPLEGRERPPSHGGAPGPGTATTPDLVGPSRRDADDGWTTIWVLGLAVVVLMVGGLAVDLFRALDERRELVAIADTAAIAGASGLEEQLLRDEGSDELDLTAARRRSLTTIARQPGGAAVLPSAEVSATPELVSVRLRSEVDLSLLRLLTPGGAPLQVEVTAEAEPGVREPDA